MVNCSTEKVVDDELDKCTKASLSPDGNYVAYELIGGKCIYLSRKTTTV